MAVMKVEAWRKRDEDHENGNEHNATLFSALLNGHRINFRKQWAMSRLLAATNETD
jgi:hypothetical protein